MVSSLKTLMSKKKLDRIGTKKAELDLGQERDLLPVATTATAATEQFLSTCCRLGEKRKDGEERVVFFDLDNTLYSKATGIAEQMGYRIQLYFEQFLHLPKEEAADLGQKYYLDYGLAIKGLIKHFQIDPVHYDVFVDGGLDLERVLKPLPELDQLLSSLEARRWIFTNAGLSHARRVLQLLKIEHYFEGIVYCDYAEPDFPAKPDRLAYERAMRCAGVSGRPELCWFVDDSANNVRTAQELGWRAVHLDERHELQESGPRQAASSPHTVSNLASLTAVFPELLESTLNNKPAKDSAS